MINDAHLESYRDYESGSSQTPKLRGGGVALH